VPVLDLAVQMRAEHGILREQIGEIARHAPALPCPWCRGSQWGRNSIPDYH
jgi:hypothetical protein